MCSSLIRPGMTGSWPASSRQAGSTYRWQVTEKFKPYQEFTLIKNKGFRLRKFSEERTISHINIHTLQTDVRMEKVIYRGRFASIKFNASKTNCIWQRKTLPVADTGLPGKPRISLVFPSTWQNKQTWAGISFNELGLRNLMTCREICEDKIDCFINQDKKDKKNYKSLLDNSIIDIGFLSKDVRQYLSV